MQPGWLFTAVAAFAYLVGSVPFSLLIAQWAKGIDLRKVGSGNIGATNVVRAVGYKWGAFALLCDALKGLLPTLLLPHLVGDAHPEWKTHLAVLSGVGALLGHLFPVWLGFRGGKGVATGLGVILVLAPWGTAAAMTIFFLAIFLTRIVSVGSLLAALTFGLFQCIREGSQLWAAERWSLGVFSIVAPLLILVMHRSNLARLWAGTESRLGMKSTPPEA